MIKIGRGKVVKFLDKKKDLEIVLLHMKGKEEKAINYPEITGNVEINDEVLVNLTALDLFLGTGGYHFIMGNLSKGERNSTTPGHIMKLRYTPEQIKILAVEEPASPYHNLIKGFRDLDETPVLITFLHSMLLPVIAGIRALNPQLKVSYVMTDGGALPMAFSKNVRKLEELKWLTGTVTVGHAFGGQLEAVNIYSGLAAAYSVFKSDLIIVGMGPGIVGTGTELGTSALEVGQIINAVASLDGLPIVVPRLSFQDKRTRHYGLSHHTITVLKKIALVSATVVLPILENKEQLEYISKQIQDNKIADKHKIVYENSLSGWEFLIKQNLIVKTMGRTLKQEKAFFSTCTSAGYYAARLREVIK